MSDLFFDKHVLPIMRKHWRKCDDPGVNDWVVEPAETAVRFDCRSLPSAFVRHTGIERMEELRQTGEPCHLPFDECLFQFDEYAILARTVTASHYSNPDPDESWPVVAFNVFAQAEDVDCVVAFMDEDAEIVSKRQFDVELSHGDRAGAFSPLDNRGSTSAAKALLDLGAESLLGVLVLMSERLLLEKRVVGATLTSNARSKAKGAPTRNPYRVLTLNLAEAKRRVRSKKTGAHESPAIHWRRGHWRTLHRLSEFEHQTWVKRCLVGDPSRGFSAKHYALKWQPTIH